MFNIIGHRDTQQLSVSNFSDLAVTNKNCENKQNKFAILNSCSTFVVYLLSANLKARYHSANFEAKIK